jgi:hypothetical protein
MEKQLVNGVTLEIGETSATINVSLSIPVSLSLEDRERVKSKDIDLGVISFSEDTSDLIRKVGDVLGKELLSKL